MSTESVRVLETFVVKKLFLHGPDLLSRALKLVRPQIQKQDELEHCCSLVFSGHFVHFVTNDKKSREGRATFDWLKVNNSRLNGFFLQQRKVGDSKD